MKSVGKYTIKEIRPRIFALEFKRRYDLCMTFLRYQEFYESPNPRFRDNSYSILEFMEWYSFSREKKGVFTYPADWSGFNIPGDTIKQCWEMGIFDRNIYDFEMKMLYQKFLEQYPDNRFYIIGANKGAAQTMKHEIAHGFFYTQPEYKKQMVKLVKDLKKPFYKSMCQVLKKIGYASKVYVDECQAYLSTGVPEYFKLKISNQREPFIQLYDEWYEK